MAFSGEYKCSGCGKIERADLLTAKKVMFQELGVKPRTLKSRIESWLCPQCVVKDPAWNMPAYSSPGMQPAPLRPRQVSDEERREAAIKVAQAAYDQAWANAPED